MHKIVDRRNQTINAKVSNAGIENLDVNKINPFMSLLTVKNALAKNKSISVAEKLSICKTYEDSMINHPDKIVDLHIDIESKINASGSKRKPPINQQDKLNVSNNKLRSNNASIGNLQTLTTIKNLISKNASQNQLKSTNFVNMFTMSKANVTKPMLLSASTKSRSEFNLNSSVNLVKKRSRNETSLFKTPSNDISDISYKDISQDSLPKIRRMSLKFDPTIDLKFNKSQKDVANQYEVLSDNNKAINKTIIVFKNKQKTRSANSILNIVNYGRLHFGKKRKTKI